MSTGALDPIASGLPTMRRPSTQVGRGAFLRSSVLRNVSRSNRTEGISSCRCMGRRGSRVISPSQDSSYGAVHDRGAQDELHAHVRSNPPGSSNGCGAPRRVRLSTRSFPGPAHVRPVPFPPLRDGHRRDRSLHRLGEITMRSGAYPIWDDPPYDLDRAGRTAR